MGFIAHRMYAARINPSVVEIEKRTNGNGVVDLFVGIADRVQRFDVRRADRIRLCVHLLNETHQRFFRFRQARGFQIGEHALNKVFIT